LLCAAYHLSFLFFDLVFRYSVHDVYVRPVFDREEDVNCSFSVKKDARNQIFRSRLELNASSWSNCYLESKARQSRDLCQAWAYDFKMGSDYASEKLLDGKWVGRKETAIFSSEKTSHHRNDPQLFLLLHAVAGRGRRQSLILVFRFPSNLPRFLPIS